VRACLRQWNDSFWVLAIPRFSGLVVLLFCYVTYFQDTMVHRVKGKEVEKLREEEKKQKEFDRARQDTLMKIDDYGKRKEVLDNADTTYLTNTKHDVRTKLDRFNIFRCNSKLFILPKAKDRTQVALGLI
jgi:hypothetical protein